MTQVQVKNVGIRYLWSDNTEDDGNISVLPYNETDELSLFVYDLEHYPAADVQRV